MNQPTIEKFWINDFGVLFRNGNWYKIFPTSEMSTVQQLNALTRLFIYLLIIFLIIPSTRQYFYLPIIGFLIIIIYYYYWRSNILKEKFNNDIDGEIDNVKTNICQPSTINNPFMNVSLADLMDKPNRPKACNNDDDDINDEISNNYQKSIIQDSDDAYDRKHSQRSFYTMPSTTVPNDQTAFANWLYASPATCKENPLNCLRYEDIRYTR